MHVPQPAARCEKKLKITGVESYFIVVGSEK